MPQIFGASTREVPIALVNSATAASFTLGAVSFTDAGDIVQVTGFNHGLSNGNVVSFSSITSTTGISINTNYYVISATSTTFQLSLTSGGSAIALTTNGTGILSTSYYASVHAQVKNGGSLNSNGVTVLSSATWSVINNLNGLFRMPGTAGTSIPGFVNNYTPGALSSATTADAVTSAPATSAVQVFANSTAMTSDKAEFKVPVGTVIVGSGDARYSIEIYKL